MHWITAACAPCPFACSGLSPHISPRQNLALLRSSRAEHPPTGAPFLCHRQDALPSGKLKEEYTTTRRRKSRVARPITTKRRTLQKYITTTSISTMTTAAATTLNTALQQRFYLHSKLNALLCSISASLRECQLK